MKSGYEQRLQSLWPPLAILIVFSITDHAIAITENNPYSAIAGRNVFALRPPPPPAANTPPPAAPPGIELQGISTILGRPQVLLKIKMPPRPPEPAKDKSVVLDIGQREGEVEVLAIDNVAGIVKLKNQGGDLSLSMKDNAAKPAAGPALPGPSSILPPPSAVTPAGGGGAIPPPAGGGAGALPTRQIRTDTSGASSGAASSGATGATDQHVQTSSRSVEQNVALYEANRAKNEELIKSGVKLPRMPLHPLLRKVPAEDGSAQ